MWTHIVSVSAALLGKILSATVKVSSGSIIIHLYPQAPSPFPSSPASLLSSGTSLLPPNSILDSSSLPSFPSPSLTDIDECANSSANNCSLGNATCTNTEGGFNCTCKEGFVSYRKNNSLSCLSECRLIINCMLRFELSLFPLGYFTAFWQVFLPQEAPLVAFKQGRK